MRISDIYDRFVSFFGTCTSGAAHTKIIAAVSGGSDSMLMLNLLYELHKEGRISLYAFHLNHMLRTEADEEEDFVRVYCERLGIPLQTQKADVREYARREKISEETAGRILRYESMRRLKEKLGYDYIATAHHADDNAESVLMHLLRGCSVSGLCGISPVNGDVIRPVLFLSKAEIEDICSEENIPYVTDMSNFDDVYLRNRIRNNVIPLLKRENPSFTDAVLRMNESMREVNGYISRQTEKISLSCSEGKISCGRSALVGEDEFIISQVIIRMCRILTGGRDVGSVHIKKIAELVCGGGPRWSYRLPGIWVYMFDDVLSMNTSEAEYEPCSYEYTVDMGSVQYFPREKIRIETKIIKKDENFCAKSYIKAVDYDKIADRLFITSRKDGMKFRPAGRHGSRRISKYFSDMKLPMALRDIVPVFMCGDDIVCVGNMDVDEKYAVTEDTTNILTVNVIYEGEPTDETYEG